MRNRFLIFVLTVCFLVSPLTVYAEDDGFKEKAFSDNAVLTDSLYENGEIAEEIRVKFSYDRDSQAVPVNMPEIGCQAAYVADPVTGKVFYEKNAHKRLFPASTTKIITALLTLENCDADDTVVVSQRAIDLVPEGYQTANLQAGEQLSVYTLLQALLIPSANEAAYALAEHVGGSVEGFAELCNKRAKELGCEDLHFVNPNGVHDDNHYCTAYDLYLIAKECQKYDAFNEIVSTESFTVPATDIYPKADRTYANTNELLHPSSPYYYESCTGIKTGHTTPAGECLVSSSFENDLGLICVVLGGRIIDGVNERFTDSKKLLEFVYENYEIRQIADKSKPVAQVNIENAVSDTPVLDIVIRTDISSVAPKNETEYGVKTEMDTPLEFKAPIKKGEALGTITYNADGLEYTVNLVAANEIIKKPYWIYNLLVAAGVILIIIIIVTILKRNKRKKAAARRRMKAAENDYFIEF